MNTYSEILKTLEPRLKELGFDGPSPILQEYGDRVFSEVNESLKATILEGEIRIRGLAKTLEETVLSFQSEQEQAEEENKIDLMLRIEIGRQFPYARMREPFNTLWEGFLIGTISNLKKAAKFYITKENTLGIGERKEQHQPSGHSDLDKILADARVSRFSKGQEGIEEMIDQAVPFEIKQRFFEF